jgi:hypothetical protein
MSAREPSRPFRQARPAEKPLSPALQLAKAASAAGDMWGDAAVAVQPVAQAPARRGDARPEIRDGVRKMEQVRSMAEEARALGYKLVPAGLEQQAKEFGYDLVPRGATASRQPDGGVTQEDGGAEMASPGKLEVLAEEDVEHRLSALSQTKQAKRLRKQAALEQRLKLEFQAQHDMKMAQLRQQARAKRAAEQRAADEAVNRYKHMLTFPDQSRAALMKIAEEQATGVQHQNEEVAAERKSAGKLAANQLAHYNLRSFHEDEFHKLGAEGGGLASIASDKDAPAKLDAARHVDMPGALRRATQELAAAKAQIAQDTLALAAKPRATLSRASAGSKHGASPLRSVFEAHSTARDAAEGVRGKEGSAVQAGGSPPQEAVRSRPRLSWNGRGIPRF